MMGGERRHAGEAHAILDDPEKFAVRKILRRSQAQIRRLRIHAAAEHGLSTAIVSMANGAVIGEVQTRIAQTCFRGLHRIDRRARV